MSYPRWSDSEIQKLEVLQNLYPFDYKKISEELGRTPRSIRNNLKSKLGLTKSEEQPYWFKLSNIVRTVNANAKENAGFMLLFNDFKRGAEGKKLGKRRPSNFSPREFTITPEFMLDLFKKQEGRCYLSGVEITLPETTYDFRRKVHTASIDRIDSKLGYTEDNVCWVHKEVNILKGSFSNEKLIYWSRKISKNTEVLHGV